MIHKLNAKNSVYCCVYQITGCIKVSAKEEMDEMMKAIHINVFGDITLEKFMEISCL
jgi:hypothetical protein